MPGEHARSPLGSQAVHSRLTRRYGAAREHSCIACGAQALDWAYQYNSDDEVIWSNGGRGSEDLECYAPMCRKCHIALDHEKDPAIQARKVAGGKNSDSYPGGMAYAIRVAEERLSHAG